MTHSTRRGRLRNPDEIPSPAVIVSSDDEITVTTSSDSDESDEFDWDTADFSAPLPWRLVEPVEGIAYVTCDDAKRDDEDTTAIVSPIHGRPFLSDGYRKVWGFPVVEHSF